MLIAKKVPLGELPLCGLIGCSWDDYDFSRGWEDQAGGLLCVRVESILGRSEKLRSGRAQEVGVLRADYEE